MNDFMAYWAENYQLGIGLLFGIVFLIYITVSVLAIRSKWKRTGDISVLGMLPLVNIALFFTGKKKVKEEAIADDMF